MLNALTNSRFFSMLEVLTIFAMREARQRRATLVCYADKRTWNRVVFNLGEFALTACQLRSR